MFGKKASAGGVVAVVDIESGSAGVAIVKTGGPGQVLAYAREHLSLEERAKESLRSAIIQALVAAGEKALTAHANNGGPKQLSACYCVIGAPWTSSFAGSARSKLEHPAVITDKQISALAKQALADQKDIDPANLLEANVSRVLLNGYPTSEPEGKRAQVIDVFTLTSGCDADLKSAAAESLAKLFPDADIVWRSSARATFSAVKQLDPVETCLVIDMGTEATDLIGLRKGMLEQRVLIEQGVRKVLATFAKDKPVEETIALIDMLEKDQCETDVCEALRQSIAKAEPELVHLFGEALAKLSATRKLPDELVLIAPPALAPWLSRFFARIDFTQFTATTKPFSVRIFSGAELPGIPHNDPSIFADPSICMACGLVNMELSR
ncbi:MAG TPA: hypothetical protein VG102_02100 [Candidatus Paceibacterota bacterium]|jgi:hypothetical protein|nr:hypothetical protein [Candidatus Paceibacterota bacterium]